MLYLKVIVSGARSRPLPQRAPGRGCGRTPTVSSAADLLAAPVSVGILWSKMTRHDAATSAMPQPQKASTPAKEVSILPP